ncbi:UBA and UBX domain-containing protein [Pyrus ussuriensis x Pyrus communis]|uniref:UBA and UBX domain-containing protein n=1 Tax=Pyrus ussuriensis x Pyrus communis TaxID=2448454 RepID=A0A5N5IJ63_9ROSA|nr:UBA and UBX domain-containing protein [Pyrus ussuriensis x Pyrus communis]
MASEDKKKSRTGGIRTLSDLNRRSADSDSDSDGPPEYYTGGEKRHFWVPLGNIFVGAYDGLKASFTGNPLRDMYYFVS